MDRKAYNEFLNRDVIPELLRQSDNRDDFRLENYVGRITEMLVPGNSLGSHSGSRSTQVVGRAFTPEAFLVATRLSY